MLYQNYMHAQQPGTDYVSQQLRGPQGITLRTPHSSISYGGQSFVQDQTPKYIKNLRSELNIALNNNLALQLRLDHMEKVNQTDLMSKIIDIGERFSQDIKKAEKTT
jgi:hypothetical protein